MFYVIGKQIFQVGTDLLVATCESAGEAAQTCKELNND